MFERTRKEVEGGAVLNGHVRRVQETIRDACGNDVGTNSYQSLASFLGANTDGSMLVLFRRRAEVLIASSYCSKAGVEHRLRISGSPVIVSPWIGWLFGDFEDPIITRKVFNERWDRQEMRAPAPFRGQKREECWALLYRMAAGRRPGTIDLVQLRKVVARSRPPVELCLPECGVSGPILGSIHASKGREADTVMLVMPATSSRDGDRGSPAVVFEEGRVYYVGATRARKMMIVAANKTTPVGYLESRRIYRRLSQNKVQLEIGRAGDVDRLAHLNWTRALEIQEALASCVGRTVPLQACSRPELDYALRLVLGLKKSDGVTRYVEIGEMSQSFRQELWKVCSIVDAERKLKPPSKIPYLYLVAVTTVGLNDDHRAAVGSPFSQSGFALAPIVKGFPTLQFFRRGTRRNAL